MVSGFQHLFRATAVFLLLLTGVEMFACEILSPDGCEFSGSAKDTSQPKTGDSCLCCCAHFLLTEAIVLPTFDGAVPSPEFLAPPTPQEQPVFIYHPPKA